MEEEIIKAALLGTGKVSFTIGGDLQDIASRITNGQEDKEDAFLKLAAVSFLYEESGLEPAEGTPAIEECAAGTKKQLSPDVNQILRDTLSGKDELLFDYLIMRTVSSDNVASPALVPMLLDKALERKKKARIILQACGETGKWLCHLNPEWKKIDCDDSEPGDWETGSHEERKRYFKALRERNPSEARTLLIASLEQENAAGRAEFIDLLETGISLADEEFLLQVMEDKSKKVRESALRLLMALTGSRVNRSFVNHLLQVISLKEERHLLLLKRKVLHLDISTAVPDDVLQYAIEKVSSQKGVEDTAFQLAQLFAYVDLTVLARELKEEKDEFVRLLLEHRLAELFRPFLSQSALLFKDRMLAEKLLGMDNGFNAGLLEILPEEQRNVFFDKYLEQHFIAVLDMLLDDQYRILPGRYSERIIKRLAANPYQVTQPVYQRLALSLPLSVVSFLQTYADDNSDDYQRRYFNNQAAMMIRYIELRETLHF